MLIRPDVFTIALPPRREFHYWHPLSEPYATPSQLISAILRNWLVEERVTYNDHALRGARQVRVYHFTLQREDAVQVMPVIDNPSVARLLYINPFEVMAAASVVQANSSDTQLMRAVG